MWIADTRGYRNSTRKRSCLTSGKRESRSPRDEKEYNRALSRIRVKVENVIRRLKIFRILCERYRNKCRRYGIKFNIIAGIVNLKMGY